MYGLEDLDIIEERDGYRVRLEVDTDPLSPDDSDAMVPVLRLDSEGYYGTRAEAFNNQANDFESAYNHFAEFANRRALEVFERYVRIFHGATKVDTWNVGITQEYGYLGFDTAEWRERVGADPENLKDEDLLSEVRAWATGEVYGVIVERRVTGTTVFDAEDLEDEDMQRWDEVEAVWGHNGREWAKQAAKEALADVLKEEASK